MLGSDNDVSSTQNVRNYAFFHLRPHIYYIVNVVRG